MRTEVALALLGAPAPELLLPLELVCAAPRRSPATRPSTTAARRARAPLALGDELPEAADAGVAPGSLADGLDDVIATAHRRRVRADLVLALARLDAPQRAAISAHAEGGAARAAGLPRSTYYRMLAHAQARLSGDLRGRLAGIGALGGLVQRAREVFQHVEAVHGAAAAATAAVAVTAAVVLGVHDERAHRFASPVAAVASGGRVAPAPAGRPRDARDPPAPSAHARAPAGARRPPRPARRRPRPRLPRLSSSSTCTYDPSTYDC